MDIDFREAEKGIDINQTSIVTPDSDSSETFSQESFLQLLEEPGQFVSEIIKSPKVAESINEKLVEVAAKNGTRSYSLTPNYIPKVTEQPVDTAEVFNSVCDQNCNKNKLLFVPVTNS